MYQSPSTDFIISYAETTKHVCLYTALSVILIIIFVLSPFSNFIFASLVGKLVIIALLGYIINKNINHTNFYKKEFNVNLSTMEWNQIKMNIVCGYVFSLFLILLLITIIKSLF
jgi:hypothetical protein